MPHETLWITQNLRTAPTPRHHAPGAGVEPARGGTPGPGVRGIRLAVAPGLGAGGRGGLSPQADPWPAAPLDRPAVYPSRRAVAPGCHSPWLRQRAMDPETYRRRDSGPLWGALSPRSRLEAPAPLRLERPGARPPGDTARRTGHGALETLHVARDKKKPDDVGPTSPSWMRVACCLSPHVAAPGRLGSTRPSSPTTTGMTGSRHWLPSPCRPRASIWASISASSHAT